MRVLALLAVGFGMWDVDCGLWTVGCGLWTVGCGLWTVGRMQINQSPSSKHTTFFGERLKKYPPVIG
jgi:hypothetical protein